MDNTTRRIDDISRALEAVQREHEATRRALWLAMRMLVKLDPDLRAEMCRDFKRELEDAEEHAEDGVETLADVKLAEDMLDQFKREV